MNHTFLHTQVDQPGATKSARPPGAGGAFTWEMVYKFYFYTHRGINRKLPTVRARQGRVVHLHKKWYVNHTVLHTQGEQPEATKSARPQGAGCAFTSEMVNKSYISTHTAGAT